MSVIKRILGGDQTIWGRVIVWGVLGLVSLSLSISAQCVLAIDVSGVVRENDMPQAPIEDARVTLFDDALTFFEEDRSGVLGGFSFSDIPAGDYRLGVSALNFDYQETQITLISNNYNTTFFLEPEMEPGEWKIIGSTLPEFLDATDISILLPDGSIFFCHDTTDPIRFDPLTGQNTYPSSSGTPQGCQNATLLESGSFIMVGGQTPTDPGSFKNAIPWVKTYDPNANSWVQLEDMQHAVGRWYPGLARLTDGSLLVIGGGTAPDAVRTDTCEIFDLVSETWSYTGSMLNPVEFPPSTLLYTGEVLATWSPPQLYNQNTGQWRLTGNFNQPNRGWPGHSDHSIVVLDDGRVLAAGIIKGNDDYDVMGEIYDPATETWSLTSNPDLIRFQSEVVQLPNGQVLVAGGETEEDPVGVENTLGLVKWSDLYDPVTDQWRRVADMNVICEYHAVSLLIPDGRVVKTGGTKIKFQVGPTSGDIEAYCPPYLFRGVRPQITSISTAVLRRGCPVSVEIFPDTRISRLVLMGTQSHTHWLDGGINRRIVLPVEQTGSTVSATLPSDANILPLG